MRNSPNAVSAKRTSLVTRRLLLLPILWIALQACRRDLIEPGPTRTLAIEPIDPSDGSDTTWDYFSADETITSTGPVVGGTLSPADGARGVAYHMAKSRKEDGSWLTVISYDAVTPFGAVPPDSRHTIIARVETDEDNNFRMYDTQGRLLNPAAPLPDTVPSASSASAKNIIAAIRSSASSRLSKLGSQTISGSPPGFGEPSSVKAKRGSRDWLANILITPEAQRRNRDAIRRRFGESKEKIDKKDRYLTQAGGHTVEILVDPDIGAVVEMNVAEGGRLRAHTRYSYAAYNDSVYVRTTTHREFLPPNSDKRLIVESSLRNVRVGRRGTR